MQFSDTHRLPTCEMEYHHTSGEASTCWLHSGFEEKDPGVLVNKKLVTGQQ